MTVLTVPSPLPIPLGGQSDSLTIQWVERSLSFVLQARRSRSPMMFSGIAFQVPMLKDIPIWCAMTHWGV